MQSLIIGQENQPSPERLSHTHARMLHGSKSVAVFPSFSPVDGLGESKKQARSNAKAFRAIDRAADVLQIGQVHWPF